MRHRDEIDGLRAVAVLPVILFHAGFEAFQGGFVGVDVFFVISGYLITTIILDEKTAGTFTLARFYERRARRILPALFFVMFTCLPFAWLWLLPEHLKQFAQSLAAVPVFASNVLFFVRTGYFATGAELLPLLHTWSLAVEEQYYVVFPLLVSLAWPLGRRGIAALLLVLGLASLVVAQSTSIQYPAFAFFLPPARLWELLLGAGVSLYVSARPHTLTGPVSSAQQLGAALGLALIFYATFAFDSSTPFPGVYALVPTLGAAAIILFATAGTVVGKLLGHRLLVGIGLISYSTYLWHQPLFAFARHRGLVEPSRLMFVALALLALVLAYGTWRFIETPFRKATPITRRQLVVFSAAGTLFFVAAGALGHVTKGFPSRLDAPTLAILETLQEGAAAEERAKRCEQGTQGEFDLQKACVLGRDKPLVGALLGDSHAGALAATLGQALSERGLGFKDTTSPGCSPVVALRAFEGDAASCFAHNTNVFNALAAASELNVVILVSRWTMWLDGNGENLNNTGRNGNGFDNQEGGVEILWRPKDPPGVAENAAREALQKRQLVRQRHRDVVLEYLKANKQVILIYPIPEMGWDVPSYLAKKSMFAHILRPEDASTGYALYKKRNQEAISILDAIGEHPHLTRIKPDLLLCDTWLKDRCVAQINNEPLYIDDDHLSPAGAKLVVDAILKQVVWAP